MAFSLIPDAVYPSVFDLDAQTLARRKITLVLADLDNTLVPYGETVPGAELLAWAQGLREAGIGLFILSNNRKKRRAGDFARAMGVPFLGHAGKPKKSGFLTALAQMGGERARTVMVGDQIFTDIAGANNAGILSVAVRPIRFGNPLRVLRYAVELPFRALAAGRRL